MADRTDGDDEPDASSGGEPRRPHVASIRRTSVRAFARLPRPARLLWIFLAVLGGSAVALHLNGMGLGSLVVLPSVAALADLALQRARFGSVRAPDAALATGMFLALLLPPTASLPEASVVVLAAITLRHAIRYRERPWFNPAAVGVLIGAIAFGMAPSWWGSIDVMFVVALGIVLTLRTPGSWRLPAGFFLSYAVLTPLANLVLGAALSPQLLVLSALDPSMLFFGFFMVAEPRTSLTRPTDRWFNGLYVGIATVFLPAIFPSLAPFVALVFANSMTIVMRAVRPAEPATDAARKVRPGRRGRNAPRARQRRSRIPDGWEVGHRVTAGVLVLALVGAIAIAAQGPTATPAAAFRAGVQRPATTGGAAPGCTQDNPSVPSDLLSWLHQRLGPSVVLSVDQNSGTVVFYDPVHKATITETDMYEDFGFAEFNGDDYAVLGCSA